jgi:hypothetical protein
MWPLSAFIHTSPAAPPTRQRTPQADSSLPRTTQRLCLFSKAPNPNRRHAATREAPRDQAARAAGVPPHLDDEVIEVDLLLRILPPRSQLRFSAVAIPRLPARRRRHRPVAAAALLGPHGAAAVERRAIAKAPGAPRALLPLALRQPAPLAVGARRRRVRRPRPRWRALPRRRSPLVPLGLPVPPPQPQIQTLRAAELCVLKRAGLSSCPACTFYMQRPQNVPLGAGATRSH